MIQQVTINTLLKEYKIEDIEKHLIFHFLKVRGLDYQNSPFLIKYFSDFSTNEGLSAKIVELNHIELTDITSDMELLIPKEDKKTSINYTG